ncbi:kinase-like protein [Ceratobasidium sp. AG-I]|nr:kinase-like protein [Ceratobasidium sp. AG-I]
MTQQAAHELHVWSKCTHPYVQELLGVECAHSQIAMISPWLEHGTLPEYLKHNPSTNRLKMCIQIAEGLAYLHRRGIIHGDIKGCNILVGDDYTPKLTDFGNGALQDYSLCFATTTTKNHISWRWTSPELYDGGKESKEADVYALGMVSSSVIMGKLPFHGMKESQIMRFVTSGRTHERPEEFIPTGRPRDDILWSILLKCWAYESTQRPSAAEVWKEVRDESSFIGFNLTWGVVTSYCSRGLSANPVRGRIIPSIPLVWLN